MSNESTSHVEQFKSFAEERLNNHLMELNTHYGGQNLESHDLRNKAFNDHRYILENELEHEKS